MGLFDTFCLICGGPFYQPENDSSDGEQMHEHELEWLENITILTRDKKTYSTGVRIDQYGMAYCGGSKFPVNPQQWSENKNDSLPCHTNCYLFLIKKLKYKLEFTSDIVNLICGDFGGLYDKELYRDLEQYQEQTFDFDQLIENSHQWLLANPLLANNTRNAERIFKIWELVISTEYQMVQKWKKMPLRELKALCVSGQSTEKDRETITQIYNEKKINLIQQLSVQNLEDQFETKTFLESEINPDEITDFVHEATLHKAKKRQELLIKRLSKNFSLSELKLLQDLNDHNHELVKRFNMWTDHTLLETTQRNELIQLTITQLSNCEK